MFFPPGFCDVWGICLLLLLIICPHFSFWINLHVCSGLFSWFYIFIYSERGPPDCKLQVPQDLNPALARGHAVSLPQAPECSFSPHISHDVTFPLGTSVAVVEAPARAPRAASVRVASVPAAHFPQMPPPTPGHLYLGPALWSLPDWGTTSPGVAKDGQRQGYKCSIFLLQSTTLKVWSAGRSPTDQAQGDPTSHSCSWFPHPLQVFPESITCIRIRCWLHLSADGLLSSSLEYNVKRAGTWPVLLTVRFCRLVLGR